MKKLTASFAILSSFLTINSYASDIKCDSVHTPFKLVNHLNNDEVTDVYLLAKGLHIDEEGKPDKKLCVVKVTKNENGIGIGTCEKVTAASKVSSYWFKLADFPNGICMPMVESGRLYVSLNHILDNVNLRDDKELSFTEPDPFKPNDQDYYKLWDKIEFTYLIDEKNHKPTLWANPTAVDFFSLPITLQLGDQTENISGLAKTRSEIFTGVHKVFDLYANQLSGKEWQKLFLYSQDGESDANVLRLMSPGKAIIQKIQPDNKTFNQIYLSNDKFGFNYLDKVWNYYKTNKLSIDVSEQYYDEAGSDVMTGQVVNVTNINNKIVPVFQFKCTKGKCLNTTLQFTQPVILTIGRDGSKNPPNPADYEPGSLPLFAGSGLRDENASLDDFDSKPGVVMLGPVIQREISSAFVAGMLPAPPIDPGADSSYGKIWTKQDLANYGVLLNKDYFEFARQQTPSLFYSNLILNNLYPEQKTNGPWFDLYSMALHSFHDPIYTFAYDDALGQDGTLSAANPGLLTITLGDIKSTTVPIIGANEGTYQFIFNFPKVNNQFPSASYCTSTDVGDTLCAKGIWQKMETGAGNISYHLPSPLLMKTSVGKGDRVIQISAKLKTVKPITEDAITKDLANAIDMHGSGMDITLAFPAF